MLYEKVRAILLPKKLITEKNKRYCKINTSPIENLKIVLFFFQFSKTAIPGSSMSCVDSTNYEGSVADLKDLDVDQIKLFENYRFKDPSDVSNNLEIAKFKYDVMYTFMYY